MTITLYVQVDHYGGVDVDTYEEHQQRMENDFNDMMDDSGVTGDDFESFLSDNFYMWELFKMNEQEQQNVLDDYKVHFFEEYNVNHDWIEIEKEIEG